MTDLDPSKAELFENPHQETRVDNILPLTVTTVALLISIFSSYVAWSSLKTAKAASRAAIMQNLFTANQAALQYPELLVDVHGIDPATTVREARALVYMSILLDGFQEVHGRIHRGDFASMARHMKIHGDSLRRFLALPANRARWQIVRGHSYGDFEAGFAAALDDLITFEENLRANPQE
ncbi:hypothetical protein ACWEQ2_19095 [Streptomyces sp. NPDC004096]